MPDLHLFREYFSFVPTPLIAVKASIVASLSRAYVCSVLGCPATVRQHIDVPIL